MNAWILDNPKHEHLSIQDIDIEKSITPQLVIDWLQSIKTLSLRATINVLGVLRVFFSNMIAHEKYFSEDFVSLKFPLFKQRSGLKQGQRSLFRSRLLPTRRSLRAIRAREPGANSAWSLPQM